MKKVAVLSHETFRCYWNNVPQPVGAFTRQSVRNYIINSINSGNAKIEQFKVRSNYGEYNTADFIKVDKPSTKDIQDTIKLLPFNLAIIAVEKMYNANRQPSGIDKCCASFLIDGKDFYRMSFYDNLKGGVTSPVFVFND